MEEWREGRDAIGSQILGETNHEQEGHHKHGEGRQAPHQSAQSQVVGTGKTSPHSILL